MKNYNEWRERNLSVTSLLLDIRNPRLPESGQARAQRDIIIELLDHDNVYQLAKDIADQGFYPAERLIGVEENGRTVIVEGNRRLAALKLLLNPELAPDRYLKRVRILRDGIHAEDIRKVPVVVAPSRDATAPMIIGRHTRTGIERWKPAQQAKFIRLLATPDLSVEEVAERLGMTRGELTTNLKTDTMYQIACALLLPDDLRAHVRNPRTFNASVLERLVQSSRALEFLGIQLDERGSLSGHIDPEEFKKGYRRMVVDIAQNDVDTRTLNSMEEIDKYLNKFGDDTPDDSRKGNFTSATFLATVETIPEETLQPLKPKSARRAQTHLIPSHIKCQLRSRRINDVFTELRKLKLSQYPNACAILFRILLELITGNYLEKTQKILPLLQAAEKKKKGQDWYPTLRQMLSALAQDRDLSASPLARKALAKVIGDKDHPLSLDKLDSIAHNRYVAPKEKELLQIWELLEEIVIQLLAEPVPPKTAKQGA